MSSGYGQGHWLFQLAPVGTDFYYKRLSEKKIMQPFPFKSNTKSIAFHS
jgi:hypothetical protein